MLPLDSAGVLAEHDDITDSLLKSLERENDTLVPVVDTLDGTLVGVTTRRRLTRATSGRTVPGTVREATQPCKLIVHQNQTLRQVAYLFAETGLGSAPVIDPATHRPVGVITLRHLLHARLHDLTEEHHRERVLPRQADGERVPAADPRTAA